MEKTPNHEIPCYLTGVIMCLKCRDVRPHNIPSREWARTVVGPLPDGGIQIWCMRCNENVFLVGGDNIRQKMKALLEKLNENDPSIRGVN